MSNPVYINDSILNGSTCPYCGGKTSFVDSSIIYGKSYGMIYLCSPCQAYCGVHKGTNISLGRLANRELRELKKQAHEFFDKIWSLKIMERSEAYQWLAGRLEIPKELMHIGMMNEKQCEDIIYFSKQFLNDNRRLDLDFGVEPKTEYFEL